MTRCEPSMDALSPPPLPSPPPYASPVSSVGSSDRSISPSPGDRPRSRKWSSPLTTSVRSLFRRRGSSTAADLPVFVPTSVFFLWSTLPESVRFHVVEYVDLADINALAEVSWEAYEFSRSGGVVFLHRGGRVS